MNTDTSTYHWFEGSDSTHEVARTIAQYGPISRATLSRMLGLTQGSLSRITSDLLYHKVIEEAGTEAEPAIRNEYASHVGTVQTEEMQRIPAYDRTPSTKRGRPQTNLRLRASQRSFIGVNVHNNGITVIATDALCHPLGPALNEPLPDCDPHAVASQIASLASSCAQQAGIAPCLLGISLGGHPVESSTVTYAPFLHWDREVKLADMVQQQCAIPTLVFNDLDSLLLYESWFSEGVGVPRLALVTVGSGVGYALCENGQPVSPSDKSYGLVSHVPIDHEGPMCYAGHVGCSQCLTTNSIATEYSEMIGITSSADDFFAALHGESPQARKLLNKLCFRLGTFIAVMANFAMPSKVLVSGEISFLAHQNAESVRRGINAHRPTQASPVDFKILDCSWDQWAQAAAAHAITTYIN